MLAYKKGKVHFRLKVELKLEVAEQTKTKNYLFHKIKC